MDISLQNPFSNSQQRSHNTESINNDSFISSQSQSVKSSRSTLFGYNISKPISLLTLDLKNNIFHISKTAKEFLQSLQGECYIISVSGNPLVGKSSLLNLLISLLTFHYSDNAELLDSQIAYQNIYTVGDGKKSTTEGIEIYVVTASNRNFILMDVEGDNDPNKKQTGVWIYSNLIMTALAVSHIHIYNYNGLPQESYFSYFESINKLVKQGNIHNEFITEHIFLKRDHPFSSTEELEQELSEYQEYFDEKLSHSNGIKYNLNMLNDPPLHIKRKNDKNSCIQTSGFICKDCQESLFMKTLLDIFQQITTTIDKNSSYNSSQDLIKSLEQIIRINEKELPYYVDMGHITQIRSSKFNKDNQRIKKGLVQIQQSHIDKTLSRQIQKIFNDHPKLAEQNEWIDAFNQSLMKITVELSQLEFLMPELSKFVEENLLDESFPILAKGEKDLLLETYTLPLERISNNILDCFKVYEKILSGLFIKLGGIREEILDELKNYNMASYDATARSIVLSANFVSTSFLAFVGQEIGIKVFAGCLAGGGAVGAVLTVVAFVNAKRKWNEVSKRNKEILDADRIHGVGNMRELVEGMQNLQEFIRLRIMDLEASNMNLKEIVCEESLKNNYLAKAIESVIDKKLNNEKIEEEDKETLIKYMKIAQSNLEKFKQSI